MAWDHVTLLNCYACMALVRTSSTMLNVAAVVSLEPLSQLQLFALATTSELWRCIHSSSPTAHAAVRACTTTSERRECR